MNPSFGKVCWFYPADGKYEEYDITDAVRSVKHLSFDCVSPAGTDALQVKLSLSNGNANGRVLQGGNEVGRVTAEHYMQGEKSVPVGVWRQDEALTFFAELTPRPASP